jgi:hypothetical protein
MQGSITKDCEKFVAWWVKAFRDGRKNVTDMPRPGRPAVCEEDVQNLNTLVLLDQNITVHELGNNVGLAHSTVLHILKKQLQMQKISSKWVPHYLTEQQKWLRYEAAQVHLEWYEREDVILMHTIPQGHTITVEYYCEFLQTHL